VVPEPVGDVFAAGCLACEFGLSAGGAFRLPSVGAAVSPLRTWSPPVSSGLEHAATTTTPIVPNARQACWRSIVEEKEHSTCPLWEVR
jgi:hypothetical protein